MKRSRVNLSNTHLTTLEMGQLVPFEWYDCLPNDIARISCQATLKASPMIAPLMHRVNLLTQYYFVPYRIIWDNWQEFITGGETGTATPTYPTMKAPATEGIKKNTLFDYFGLPINKPEIEFSAMLARAYAKIWNDHYKVDDIEAEIPLETGDGEDLTTNRDIQLCHWARDRMTKAKPFTQRGAQISVPIQPAIVDNYAYPITLKTFTQSGNSIKGSSVPQGGYLAAQIHLPTITGNFDISRVITFTIYGFSTDKQNYIQYGLKDESKNTALFIPVTISQGDISSYSDTEYKKGISFNGTQIGDLSTQDYAVTGLTGSFESTSINKVSVGKIGSLNILDLRTATQLQKFQERSLKYGAEYEDYCKQEFGVSPRDSRLQKSEYLGGSQGILQISEVIQTTETTESPLGAQAGYGIGSIKQRKIRYRCPEHGVIIGIMSIRPETIYTQGIDRALLKRERFEYWTREMAGIGAQEIKTQELWADKDNVNTIFGYDLKGNYQEYYSKLSRVSGSFRDDLAFWHLGRIFDSAPVLNKSFLDMKPRKNIFAVTDQTLPAFQVYIQNFAHFYRPIPRKIKVVL